MQGGTSLDAASERLRSLLATIDKQSKDDRLGEETKDLIKSHLAEHQDALREMQERLRMSSEDMEVNRARRAELESMLDKREGAYEELLGNSAAARLAR
jgi:kinesin family protein 5